MVTKLAKQRKTSSSKGRRPRATRTAAAMSDDLTAREMAARVQKAFEKGYLGGSTGAVSYEKSANGIGADTVFFATMIFQSIRKNLGKPELPNGKADPPAGTKASAERHGAEVRKIQAKGDVTLLNILSTFYALKPELCRKADGTPAVRGLVCEF